MNTENIIDILSVLAVIVGIIGTFLPVLPGVIICFIGVLAYQFWGSGDLPVWVLVLFGLFTLASFILEYVIGIKMSKKYGGSRYGTIGGIIGALAGMAIPIPVFGILLGMFAGVFIGEYFFAKNTQNAGTAVKGAFIGFLVGTGFNLVIGLVMLTTMIIDMIW